MQFILDSKWHLFAKVAELGSLSRASAALDIPQSVISRQISQLELESGSRLFRRTGRGVVPTELGARILPRIKSLIHDGEQLADDIRASRGVPMGEVRLGLLPSTVPMVAGQLFAVVREQFPEVKLHITEGPSAQLEEWLKEGRLDLAILLREEDTAREDEPVLAQTPLSLVVPATSELTQRKTVPMDLVVGLPLIVPSDAHPLRARLLELAKEKGATLQVSAEADSIRLQHVLVAHGGGFAITAGRLTSLERQHLVAIQIVQPVLSRSIVLGTTAHRPSTSASREVSRLIIEFVPSMLLSG